MTDRLAPAKINLALVVGPLRANGKHEITTVLQRIGLSDRLVLEPAAELRVEGFAADTLVTRALELVADAAGVEAAWAVDIDKQIPVAAGLGGGSTDAAAALQLANAQLEAPLPGDVLSRLAALLGADVSFFLSDGPQLGEGDGSELTPLDLPQAFTVLILLPKDVSKTSTSAVYAAFDDRDGASGYEDRRSRLLGALASGDLASLPENDLSSSPLAGRLRSLGAFRADVSGAGPALYALFSDPDQARHAAAQLGGFGRVWIVPPAW